jgi:hypothetical protein
MSVRQGALTAITAAVARTQSVLGVRDLELFVKSADFVGTYQVSHSLDGGSTYTPTAAAVVVASGVTSTVYTFPTCTHVKLEATTYTSGTSLLGFWAGSESTNTPRWP